MDRRKFLAATAAGLPVATAGCSLLGSGDEGDDEAETPTATTMDGPASFTDVSITFPEDVVVDEEFSVTVEAQNVGGEAGVFEDTLEVASGPSDFSETVESDEVEPRESVSVDVGPITLETADEYEFALADDGTSATVRVGPQQASLGGTVTIREDLAVTVEDVTFRDTLLYPTSRQSGLSSTDEVAAFGAPSGSVLAVVSVSVENTGTETAGAPKGTIGVGDGEWYDGAENTPGALFGFSGERFYGGEIPEIEPSGSTTGYYLAQVPRETARGDVEITAQIDSSGTLPERVWTASPSDSERSLPAFTLESIDAPEATELGQRYELTLTVANEGDASGTFSGVVQYRDDGEWGQLTSASSASDLDADRSTAGVIEREIEAGGTAEITLTNYSPWRRQYTFRIAPLGEEWQTQYEQAVLSRGDRLMSNNNAAITVEEVRTDDTLTVYDDWSDEEEEAEPDDGNQYVSVRVRFTKLYENQEYARTPEASDFSLADGDTTVSDSTYVDGEMREDWYEPLDGDLENQSEVAGWMIKEAPAEYAASELTVEYQNSPGLGSDYETVARWEP